MRNKYDYFVNNEKVMKKDFVKELKSCCQKVIRTDVIAGWCGVSLMDFDEEKFRQNMRDIENGVASTGFIQLRVNSDKVLPQYLYYYLTTDKKVQEYQAIAETSQSTFPSFNKEVIETMDFPDISLEGQYYLVDTVC